MNTQNTLTLSNVLPEIVKLIIGGIHTMTIAKVDAYNATNSTVDCTPLINKVNAEGEVSEYKKISDVPIIFPKSNNGGLYFPISKDDCGLLIFAERSTEEVLESLKKETPSDNRMYSLSDGFFIPGLTGTEHTSSTATELIAGNAKVKIENNKIAIGTSAAELLSIFADTLQYLSTTTVLVAGVPVPLSTTANFTTLLVKLNMIKGSI